MKIKEFFRKLLDPAGPLGEIVSPSIVFKTRQGIPITAPGATAVSLNQYFTVEQLESMGKTVPADRRENLSPRVDAVWTPVYGTTDSENFAEIFRVARTLLGWRINLVDRAETCDCKGARFQLVDHELVHVKCGRMAAPIGREHAEDFYEHIQSLSFGVTDEFYNTFYTTIKGNDSIMTEAGPAKGGTRITGGRAEYREKTRGMVHWDKGFLPERAKAEGQEKKDRKEAVVRHAEVFTKKFFPRRAR